MALVKVWNDDTRDYVEKFEHETIRIPAKGYIEMSRAKAKKFQGTYVSTSMDLPPDQSPYKMIRLEYDPESEASRLDQPFKYKCELTGKEFRTAEGLRNHQQSLGDLGDTNVKAKGSRSTSGSK